MKKDGRPHAVLRYDSRFMDQRRTTWEVSVNPNGIGWMVTPQEAKKVIEDWGLEVAFESEDGVIYDTPDRKFLKLYQHKFNEIEYERA